MFARIRIYSKVFLSRFLLNPWWYALCGSFNFLFFNSFVSFGWLLWCIHISRFFYSFVGEGFVGVCIEWGPLRRKCFVVNIYSKCDLVGKQCLWERLVLLRNSLGVGAWCFIGDFNLAVHREERRGSNVDSYGISRREIELFSLAVEALDVEDVNLVGRKYTWYNFKV